MLQEAAAETGEAQGAQVLWCLVWDLETWIAGADPAAFGSGIRSLHQRRCNLFAEAAGVIHRSCPATTQGVQKN